MAPGRPGEFCPHVADRPSPAFLALLPGGRVPDRRDFFDLTEARRMRRWQTILDASAALGDDLQDLIETGRLVDAVVPWA